MAPLDLWKKKSMEVREQTPAECERESSVMHRTLNHQHNKESSTRGPSIMRQRRRNYLLWRRQRTKGGYLPAEDHDDACDSSLEETESSEDTNIATDNNSTGDSFFHRFKVTVVKTTTTATVRRSTEQEMLGGNVATSPWPNSDTNPDVMGAESRPSYNNVHSSPAQLHCRETQRLKGRETKQVRFHKYDHVRFTDGATEYVYSLYDRELEQEETRERQYLQSQRLPADVFFQEDIKQVVGDVSYFFSCLQKGILMGDQAQQAERHTMDHDGDDDCALLIAEGAYYSSSSSCEEEDDDNDGACDLSSATGGVQNVLLAASEESPLISPSTSLLSV